MTNVETINRIVPIDCQSTRDLGATEDTICGRIWTQTVQK